MSYYTYVHHAGYGRDDHMADEIIDRAIRHLGGDTAHSIAQHVGLASHAVPIASGNVQIPAAPGVRTRMESALRSARQEVRRNDCAISVVCLRERRVQGADGGCYYTRPTILTERRSGRNWVLVASVESR